MQLGGNLLVVIGCRTFDREHDPQIRKWEREQIFSRKVAVSPLPEAAIREVVDLCGFQFDSLSPREKQLLSNIQNLTMWAEIADSGKTPKFSTATELSRQFWQSRWEEIAMRGVPTTEVEALLDEVTTYMESRCRLDAAARLLEQHPVAADALQSLNVLQVADRRVSFCHQSYLDYEVARKLLGAIDCDSASVLTWLGGRERQSLFRREQLRLVLLRMRDEDWLRIAVLPELDGVVPASRAAAGIRHPHERPLNAARATTQRWLRSERSERLETTGTRTAGGQRRSDRSAGRTSTRYTIAATVPAMFSRLIGLQISRWATSARPRMISQAGLVILLPASNSPGLRDTASMNAHTWNANTTRVTSVRIMP